MKKFLIFVILFLHSCIFINETRAQAGVALPNPLGTTSIPLLIGRVIQGVTGVAGSIALLMFLYGGFLWLTSGGNPEKIKKGQTVLIWSVLGMAVMFGSYIIVRYILTAVIKGAAAP